MKGLLIKDWKLLKNQKQFFLVMVFFVIMFVGFGKSVAFGSIYLLIMLSVFTLSTISYDEFDNGAAYLFTLPFNRRTYAREKYIFCLISILVSTVIIVLINIFANLIRGENILNAEDMTSLGISVLSGILTAVILVSVMIPMQLKWGSEKSRIIWMGAAVAIILLGSGGVKLIQKAQLNVSELFAWLDRIPPAVGIAGVGLVMLAGMLISCRISERIVEKKEY